MSAAEAMRNLADRGWETPPPHTLFDKNLKEYAHITGVVICFSLCSPAVHETIYISATLLDPKQKAVRARMRDCTFPPGHRWSGKCGYSPDIMKKYQQQPVRTAKSRNVIIISRRLTVRRLLLADQCVMK